MIQKQPFRSIFTKKLSENMRIIDKITPMPKCSFNKVALQEEHLWSAVSTVSKLEKISLFKNNFIIFSLHFLNNFVICIKTIIIIMLLSKYIIILIAIFILCLSYFMTTLYQHLILVCLLQYFSESISSTCFFFSWKCRI